MVFHKLVDVCSVIGFSLFSVGTGALEFIKMGTLQIVDGAGVISIFIIMMLFVQLLHSFDRTVELLNYGIMLFLFLKLFFFPVRH